MFRAPPRLWSIMVGTVALATSVGVLLIGGSAQAADGRTDAPADILAAGATAAVQGTGRAIDRPVPTTGCGRTSPVPAGETTSGVITSGGLERRYLLHVPADYRRHRPQALVLSFHGHGRTAEYQEELTGMSGLPAVVVYPQGLPGTDGESVWSGAPYSAAVDDVLFTSDLITRLQRELCIAPTRIYVAGKSNGGGFAGLLACRMAGRIAASAPVSGAFYPQGGPCTPSRPIPIVDFHGLEDTTIPYTGDPVRVLPPIPDWLTDWAARNDCSSNVRSQTVAPGVTRQRWVGCRGAAEVRHYRVAGLGHDWPSTTGNLDSDVPTTIDATPLIWRFFQQHPLRSGPRGIRAS